MFKVIFELLITIYSYTDSNSRKAKEMVFAWVIPSSCAFTSHPHGFSVLVFYLSPSVPRQKKFFKNLNPLARQTRTPQRKKMTRPQPENTAHSYEDDRFRTELLFVRPRNSHQTANTVLRT